MRKHYGAFDCLRLLAAFAVLFSHSYALLGKDANEPLARLTNGRMGLGTVAVYAFFAISGFLVTRSWLSDPSLVRFMKKRVLRIIPALILVIVASFAIVGPLTTDLSLSDYFSQRDAWHYLTKILIYPAQYQLPGSFKANPFPDVVNGSLWSLRLEFALYIIVAALGWLGCLRWHLMNMALAVICLIASIVLARTDLLGGVPFLHQTIVFFENAVPFFVGACLAQSKPGKTRVWLAALLVLATVMLVLTPAFKILLLLALPTAVILIAQTYKCNLTRFGDYSYGLYLWAFPVQQSMIHFIPNIDPILLFMLASMVAFVCAAFSWHLIEKRALTLRVQTQLSHQ